jgi:hypothetical protein
MQALPYRVIRNQPGRLHDSLGRDGIVLITKRGKPFAFMVGLVGESLEDTLGLVTQLRAQRAVASMRKEARGQGLDRLTDRQMRSEIEAARRSK